MANQELVMPDAVFAPNGDMTTQGPLDPCPTCGSRPQESPEGVNSKDEPNWTFPHCWKCGYRPGTNVAFNLGEMQRQFNAFKEWQNANTPTPELMGASAKETMPKRQEAAKPKRANS